MSWAKSFLETGYLEYQHTAASENETSPGSNFYRHRNTHCGVHGFSSRSLTFPSRRDACPSPAMFKAFNLWKRLDMLEQIQCNWSISMEAWNQQWLNPPESSNSTIRKMPDSLNNPNTMSPQASHLPILWNLRYLHWNRHWFGEPHSMFLVQTSEELSMII